MASTIKWIQVIGPLAIMIVLRFLSYISYHSILWTGFIFVSLFLACPVSSKFEFPFQIISICLTEMISIIIVCKLIVNFTDIFLHSFTHLATHLTQCLWKIRTIIKTTYYPDRYKLKTILKKRNPFKWLHNCRSKENVYICNYFLSCKWSKALALFQ